MKDKVFENNLNKKFEFDEAVASVFDDMLTRSIPFYDGVRELIISLILSGEKDGKKVLDLGSSTAKFLLELHGKMSTDMKLKGIDNSEAMISRAKQKCKAYGVDLDLELGDMLEYDYKDEDVIIANYTLQFIRPIQRTKLVQTIHQSLSDGGLFIFSEKIAFENTHLDKEMIEIYHKYKQTQGYSKFEITHKREALENVLVPFTIKENILMCKEAGFSKIDTIFQWANFVTFVARK